MSSVTDSQALEAVYQRFITSWGATTPVTFENEQTNLHEGSVPWVRLTMIERGGGQNTLGPAGSRRFRRRASVFVQIFTPANAGDGLRKSLSSQARNVFEGASFSGLDFNDAVRTDLPVDGKWNVGLIEAQFDYDEVK